MLWGGRFKQQINKEAFDFSTSLHFDIALIEEDIQGSIAHAEMLCRTGIISGEESQKIVSGLKEIINSYRAGEWKPDEAKFEVLHQKL